MKEMTYTKKMSRTVLATGTYKNYNYYVISLGTHPCGYVDAKKYIENIYDIECHGGITYKKDFLLIDNSRNTIDGSFIGWDYNHYGDYNGGFLYDNYPCRRWSTEEIVNECKNVINQLEDVNKNSR